MKVIGIGHRARQGKDSFARRIVMVAGANGYYAKQYGFADALRAYCRVAFGMTSKNATLLQTVGTEVFRDHVSRSIWSETLRYTIEEEQPDIAIITDVRFPEEVKLVRQYSGVTVKVQRYTETNGTSHPFYTADRDPNHRSEIALMDENYWDYTVANDGDLIDLSDKAKQFFNLEIQRAF
tara:strand:+ start:13861 stop:14400 length:540 start_codon:yes stop_codon:yes gene_type:complete